MTLKLVRIRRLQQLQVERGVKGPVELGRIIGRKTNQTSDLLKGRGAFGEKVARSIEANAGLPPGWLDQDPERRREDGISADLVSVPPLQPAEASSRLTQLQDGDRAATLAGSLPLSRAWIAGMWAHLDPLKLRYLEAPDHLMEPTFEEGDLLLVDTGTRSFGHDAIYVLCTNARMNVRRVRQRLDGSFEVSADSTAVKTSETITGSQLDFAGRVLYAWRGRKL
mgnify:CR=1 FL=1